MIDKGTVSALVDGGKKAIVIPSMAKGTVTLPLIVSEMLIGFINVEDEVVYSTFDDNTGIILARLDGKWSRKIDGQLEVKGGVIATDVQTNAVASFNKHTHGYTHGGDSSGNDTTSGPK